MDIAEKLHAHPLFATFPMEALAELVSVGTIVTYQPGQTCLREGEAGEIFGIVLSGQLEARCRRGGTRGEKIGTIEVGECFGEMSLLTGNPTGAEVTAAVESQAVVFLQEAIGPLIAVNREAVRFLVALIARRLSPQRSREAAPRPAAAQYSLDASVPMRILAVSCRRDDMRYSFFDTTSEKPRASGGATGLGSGAATHVHEGPEGVRQTDLKAATHAAAIEATLEALTSEVGPIQAVSDLSAVVHRVCHGGSAYDAPVVVDDDVIAAIRRLAALAPMENPYNLWGIEVCQKLAVGVPQVAVFDTAFYASLPAAARSYALPPDLLAGGELRRYGSHGISHEGAAHDACAFLGMSFNALKIISCHLGTGASVTAINHGRPVDNTMGATPLAGLMMATRCGDVDPGLILHLIADRGISAEDLTRRLYTESGLLGLSGISADVQTVLEAADSGYPQALLAIEAFCLRARKYLSAYVGLLGGVDVIVFTGGVGQNAPGLRARICQGLEWMGISLDETRNRAARAAPGEVAEISQGQSRARVLAVGSNEDHTLARQAVRALAQKRTTAAVRHQHTPIPVGVSAHHVHLTDEHVEILFGPGSELTWYADLTQPGQFACNEKVCLVGPRGRIDRVRVLGPVRPETQVEIARTEEFKLGIDAPVRMSGDLDGTPGMTLVGPKGRIEIDRGVICAMRHIHMTPEDALAFSVRDGDAVHVRVPGDRSLVFGDVVIRISPDFRLDMHIDTDEANAAQLGEGAIGYLDSIQERAFAQ